MDNYEGLRATGKFVLGSDIKVFGELLLKGRATALNLYADEPFHLTRRSDILGVLHGQRKKVSLIDCIFKSGVPKDSKYFSAIFFPHCVLFGSQHIESSDRIVTKISFSTDDIHDLFYDTSVVRSVHKDINGQLRSILEKENQEEETEIGDRPSIYYCTGKTEIVSVDTLWGEISVKHYTSDVPTANRGVHIKNEIKIDIELKSRRNVNEAIEVVGNLLRFLEVIAGRPQNISKLKFFSSEEGEGFGQSFDVYRCNRLRYEVDNPYMLLPSDLPIQAAWQSDEFSRVLKAWIERYQEWRDARDRFSIAFTHQNNYTIDRLVGAANMFDILPSSACPKHTYIPNDLQETSSKARKMFKDLPVSPERDSILSALGRIGKPSLKRKVRHRAKLITDIVGDQFPDINLVVDQAVNCRNHYVHGTETKIDYTKNFNQFVFVTDTLEFVFAASDLVEAGWDIAAWMETHLKNSCGTHPFSRYRTRYMKQLNILKMLLKG